MTYAEALDALMALPRWADAGAAAYHPGLDRMRALLAAMGDPHTRYPALHVGGTNGKGSTASFAAAILTAAGRRVGLHTSPHLLALEERMRLDGTPAPPEWLAEAVARFRPAFERVGPSFFEATTALAFLYFAEAGAEIAVVEVGLGGRLDATNVLVPLAAAVTHVGLDHTDLLGATIPAVAREKAGIAKPGVPFLTAAEGEALETLRDEAARAGAPFEDVRATVDARVEEALPGGLCLRLRTPAQAYGRVEVGLPGAHQAGNAALAVRLAETAVPGLSPNAVWVGLRDVARLSGLRGRGEALPSDPRVTLDVAHNADGWRAALAGAQPGPGGHLYALVGTMADKDAGALAALLADAGATALPVGLPGERALGREDLTAVLRAHGVPVVDVPDAVAGLAWFRRQGNAADRLLVTGSHVTVAETLRAAAGAVGENAGAAGPGANPSRGVE